MWSGIWPVATTRIVFWTCITRHWIGVGSGLLISMLEKLNLFWLTGLKTLVLLMWKWTGLFLRINNLLRCWGWLSHLNWIGALTLSPLLKLTLRKLEPWFVLWSSIRSLICFMKFLPPEVALCIYKSTMAMNGHAWNTVVISGLLLLVVTWNC